MDTYTVLVTEYESLAHPFTGSKASGKADLIGIDPGRTEVVAYNPRTLILVLKVPGHSYWNGLAQPRRHAPTTLLILELSGPLKVGVRMKAKLLVEYATGKGRG